MTAEAKKLSGGQKRKLSVGIAILGDPKVPGVLIYYYYYYYYYFSLTPRFLCISLTMKVLMWVWDCLPSDPALGRAHSRHGPLLQTSGVVFAEEPQAGPSHCPQHTLHG